MVLHWSLSDSKSPQVSRTRLRIMAVLSNAVVWIVSTRSPTSKSSRPFNNPLVIVPKAPITIGTIVIFWPSTRLKNTIPKWYTGRKWHIPMASNRKRSRGRIKAYDRGQGEGPIVPLTVMHQKRVTSELHDSYFRLMTIKHPISKIQ